MSQTSFLTFIFSQTKFFSRSFR